jgi:hypothetical protein
LTRYLQKCRIAGLAGLASLVVFAFAAAPSGAKTVCSGTAPYRSCHQVISISIAISVSPRGTVSVKIKVSDPHLNVKLYKKKHGTYRLVKTVFNGNVSGTKKLKIRHLKPGKYELKVKATVPATSTASGASKTVKKFFRVR